MASKFIKTIAPKEHQRRTGEPFITKTLIKQCLKCQRFKPHWHYLETKSLDGLGSTCKACRSATYDQRTNTETEKQRDARLNRQYEYYDDNPIYYRMMSRARYLEKKAEKAILEETKRKELHQQLFPKSPFYSARERWAQEYLLEAKKLRRKAGKPTR